MPESNGGAGGPRERAASAGAARAPRLLVLTPDFPPARGGIQLLVHRVAAGLSGFDTEVLTLAREGDAEFDRVSGVRTRRVAAPARLGAGCNVLLNAAALRAAWRFRPDLTLSAHIVTSPAAAVVRRVLGTPTVQYFYAKEIGARPRLAAFAAREANASIAISAYTLRLLAAAGVSQADLRLIPPGVDLPAEPPPTGGPGGEPPTFVTISRLADPYKGHDVLVEALGLVRERVPDVRWIVIGDGPLRGGLEALARKRGVADAVSFLGSVSDEERDRRLREADLLAMPSRLPGDGLAGEGFGIVYLEAATFGKPVVAGNVAGAPDAVADGESGLLVDPADPRAVAEAIVRLLLDPQLARRLGAAGRERAQGFAWPLIVQRVQRLLEEQLPERVCV